ncbi:MAG: glycoside hydrolase family 95 protein, partial [Ruminococcaceae bacterium]|nr:glycoside hydrolase family 95 protein [Oscillospiraceae bacterium]
MKKRALALLLVSSMVLPIIGSTGLVSLAVERADAEIISTPKKELSLWYDEEAPYGNEELSKGYSGTSEYRDIADDGWEKWSLPLGNGYSGINVFGRTDTERIQITDNTLSSQLVQVDTLNDAKRYGGGLNNFSETYLDFGHSHASVTNYKRALDLRTAVSTVNYTYNGINYSREYFTSYPDKAIVIYLAASGESNLNFTLRPTIPYEQDYMVKEGDGFSKHGTVVANADGTITLSGNLGYNNVDFVGRYKVVNNGGTVTANNGTNEDGAVDNGTLTVSGATSAYIVITLSTNYELSSDIFTTTDPSQKLSTSTIDAAATAEAELTAAMSYTYAELRARHIADYDNLFGRVNVDFGGKVPTVTTDVLLKNYVNGTHDAYLEELYFQFGRYLLISSSREGSLPANLQGTWNRYNLAPWGSGYWHNINVQMNYWPAFSTNLAETFGSYADFFEAFLPQAQKNATSVISGSMYDTNLDKDGGNGWTIGVGSQAMHISSSPGPGNVGFTTQMFWDYYDFTRDLVILEETVYPALKGASQYITKTFAKENDGTYLSIRGDSPEQWVDGVWYYTKGTTYDQSFAYTNGYYTLAAADILGIKPTDDGESVLATIMEQLPNYDPIVVGYSGQVKEFREEDYYGDLGEYAHRHISQLVGLYPGNLINSSTPAWVDAAKYTLSQREMGTAGDSWGWSIAHRQNLWARAGVGEEAYRQYQKLLSMRTATNLWSKTPAGFQIDGNFGGTAGVAEMLLQSQSGYIEPLAAIPSAWATGSYEGLVARGNFVVSAKWEN